MATTAMIDALLAFGLGLLPGLVGYRWGRGPRIEATPGGPLAVSLPAAAVLRDGAVGHTRWAFAALVCRLAQEGHCTLVRTRTRRWLRTRRVVTVERHADPTALSPLEQTVLRQLGRHNTLDGFGFAGSTFRRRTLRDVRATLVERGWLVDRRRRSNGFLGAGGGLVGVGLFVLLNGTGPPGVGAAALGLGVGGLVAGGVRYPVTEAGARHRAAHRAYARRQRECVQRRIEDDPEGAADVLMDSLPSLILERMAPPRTLRDWADHFDRASVDRRPPDWIRDEEVPIESVAGACRRLAAVLGAMGAQTLRDRFSRKGVTPGSDAL